MSSKIYTVQEHAAWRLKYDPEASHVIVEQETLEEPAIVCFTLDQIPEVVRALRRIHRDESLHRAQQ